MTLYKINELAGFWAVKIPSVVLKKTFPPLAKLIKYFFLCAHNSILLLRIIEAEGRATVLVLDDNMPLRSMRYEYYQLARKCKFNILLLMDNR